MNVLSVIPACRKRGSSLVKSLDSRFRGNDGIIRILLFVFCILHTAFAASGASRAEIRNGQFYVDGEPFYVVGVGY